MVWFWQHSCWELESSGGKSRAWVLPSVPWQSLLKVAFLSSRAVQQMGQWAVQHGWHAVSEHSPKWEQSPSLPSTEVARVGEPGSLCMPQQHSPAPTGGIWQQNECCLWKSVWPSLLRDKRNKSLEGTPLKLLFQQPTFVEIPQQAPSVLIMQSIYSWKQFNNCKTTGCWRKKKKK